MPLLHLLLHADPAVGTVVLALAGHLAQQAALVLPRHAEVRQRRRAEGPLLRARARPASRSSRSRSCPRARRPACRRGSELCTTLTLSLKSAATTKVLLLVRLPASGCRNPVVADLAHSVTSTAGCRAFSARPRCPSPRGGAGTPDIALFKKDGKIRASPRGGAGTPDIS